MWTNFWFIFLKFAESAPLLYFIDNKLMKILEKWGFLESKITEYTWKS